jgi:purine catabolism regulator
MLTIEDILTAGLLPGARIVAGRAGLGRQVLWVHNAGVPDAPQWLNGGELVMTTIINLPPDAPAQVEYVEQMEARGVAGLCLTVGKMIDHIPPHIITAAESCGLPLIEIPYTLRFVDAAREIIGRITQGSLDMVRRALSINQQLTRIVLEGGGLHELAAQLAQLVRHSISIETATFDAIATVNIADVDEARRYTQLHGRTDPRLVQALEERGYLPTIRQTLRPVQLPVMADVGLEMERLLAPVVVHGMIYGFMWIIADDHALSEIDLLAIESGATIAALMILYQETAQAAEASLKGSLLSQLIAGDHVHHTILIDQSLRYGVDLRLPYRLLVIDVESAALTPLYRQINQLASTQGWRVVVGQFAGQIVMLAQEDDHTEAVLARIVERLQNGRKRISHRAGCSAIMQGSEQVKTAHEQARDALAIGQRIAPYEPLLRFDQLGYLHTLYLAGPRGLTSNPFVPVVRRLREDRSPELLQTLEAYLDAGGNGVLAAEHLHIHRSTLNYRLTRIEQLCQLSLQDPATRANLQVAVKLLRLFDG